MNVLDLFAGLGGWSQAAREHGHNVFTVDYDEKFDVDLHKDINDLTADDLPWHPDLILASPPCEKFSVMTIGKYWNKDNTPKEQVAADALTLVENTVKLIETLQPSYWIMENPRGKLRKLDPVQKFERRTVTYCQYGMPYMKPTDLWGGFPPSLELRPMCKNGAPCHIRAVRGSTTGVQSHHTGTSPIKTAETPWKRKDGNYGPRYSSFGSEGSVAFKQVLFWSTDPRRAQHAAEVAKIPYELSLMVTQAAEHDFYYERQG